MAWSTPKTDWATDDAVGTADLNRIENNILSFIYAGAEEGANKRMGLATIITGNTIVVNNNLITANTRIFLSVQSLPASAALFGPAAITARSVGTSFTISLWRISGETGNVDGAAIAWILIEPQA